MTFFVFLIAVSPMKVRGEEIGFSLEDFDVSEIQEYLDESLGAENGISFGIFRRRRPAFWKMEKERCFPKSAPTWGSWQSLPSLR